MSVNEDTALTYSAIWLSVKIISETIAALPFNMFERVPNSTNRKVVFNHYLKTLLDYPNQEMTGFNFKRTILAHSLLWGNGYAFIARDRSNRPGELQLITPDRVNKGRSKTTKKIVYEIHNGTSPNSYLNDADMLHIPGVGFDGLTGYSVVTLARRSMGIGMAAEQYEASFYENGAQLGTVITVPEGIELDDAGKRLLLETFNDKYAGAGNGYKTGLLDEGMTIQSLGISQRDAQFIESRKFGVTDVARWFNMPPHKLKDLDRATFSNIEEQNIDFVQDTLLPWIVNVEQNVNWKLVGANNARQFMKYNLNGLLRGDAKSRADYYNTRFQMGSMSPNEIRALEDENSMGADGDKFYIQSNMAELSTIADPKPPAPPPAPPVDPNAPPPTPGTDPNAQQQDAQQQKTNNLEQFRPLIENTLGKYIHQVQDRINRGKDIHAVMNNRREYLLENIKPILAIFNDDADVMECIAVIENRVYGCEGEQWESIKNRVIDDFMEFCAKLSNNMETDDEK